jgi:LDH2 family malate/lactate/ureidoglycolate dehydrogenase
MHATPARAGEDAVRVPGERAGKLAERRMSDGIPLSPEFAATLAGISNAHGVAWPGPIGA